MVYRSQSVEIDPDLTLRDVIKQYAQKQVTIGELPSERQHIVVRRKHVWSDTKRAMRRPSFDPRIGLDITFIGEEAQDAGGPLREYFRLLWKAIAADGSIFTGATEERILTHNMLSLQNGDYALVGRCIGLAIIYGGSGPHFFAEAVTSYIFNEPIDSLQLNEIPDVDIREKIGKVYAYILPNNILHCAVCIGRTHCVGMQSCPCYTLNTTIELQYSLDSTIIIPGSDLQTV